jgi:hypothetical protein
MSSVKNPKRKVLPVSASQLAQMGVCERLVVFEHRHGRVQTLAGREATERGLRAHERFHADGLADLVHPGRRRDQVMMYRRLGHWRSWTHNRMADFRDWLGRLPAGRFVRGLVAWCAARLIQNGEPQNDA